MNGPLATVGNMDALEPVGLPIWRKDDQYSGECKLETGRGARTAGQDDYAGVAMVRKAPPIKKIAVVRKKDAVVFPCEAVHSCVVVTREPDLAHEDTVVPVCPNDTSSFDTETFVYQKARLLAKATREGPKLGSADFRAWTPHRLRRLTISSSAASVASPLERVVRWR